MDDVVRVVSLSRSALYKVVAGGFAYPTAEYIALLSARGFEETLTATTTVLAEVYRQGAALAERAQAYRRAASAAAAAPLEDIQDEHFRLFGATVSKECPPYETLYGCPSLQQNIELSKIGGFYKAFGLEMQDTAGERLDHIAAELEYMRFLCYKEAYGIEHRHAPEQIVIGTDAQKKFLREHLGKWAPLFAQRLKRQAGDGYYGALADILERFIGCELDYLKVSPQRLDRDEVVMPASLEDNACFSCGAADDCREFPQ